MSSHNNVHESNHVIRAGKSPLWDGLYFIVICNHLPRSGRMAIGPESAQSLQNVTPADDAVVHSRANHATKSEFILSDHFEYTMTEKTLSRKMTSTLQMKKA